MVSRVLDYGDEVCFEYCSCISCRLRIMEKELFVLKKGIASNHRESPV
jgi:hypothetical protein